MWICFLCGFSPYSLPLSVVTPNKRNLWDRPEGGGGGWGQTEFETKQGIKKTTPESLGCSGVNPGENIGGEEGGGESEDLVGRWRQQYKNKDPGPGVLKVKRDGGNSHLRANFLDRDAGLRLETERFPGVGPRNFRS